LRPFDRDAMTLPSRLLQLASNLLARRHAITTESWDLPCPCVALPRYLRDDLLASTGDRPRHVTDLLVAKGVPPGVWQDLLPPELLAGLKMDVNRPLGNGRDDNSNGVVDEPQEAAGEQLTLFDGPSSTVNVAVDHDNDGTAGCGTVPSRQLHARHLFVLMMLLRDPVYVFPTTEAGLTAAQQQELTVRRIAQWAVNVVDFRDADSIMTPFEYDENPFDGWDVDGDLTTDEGALRGLVWGCERPELLLTETLAFHDRRVADTAFDDGDSKKRTEDTDNNDVPDDTDLDQPRIPQGSAFFELYCTGNTSNSVASGDLYYYDAGTSQWLLDVGKLAPADSDGLQYPVWRMVISESRIKSEDNNVLARVQAKPDSTSLEPEQYTSQAGTGEFSLLRGSTEANVQIERIVWFTTQAPVPPSTPGHLDAERIYYNRGAAVGLPGGEYLIVGPRAVTAIGAKTTLGTPSEHKIRLDTVGVTDNDGTDNYPAYPPEVPTEIKAPRAMIVAGEPPSAWTDTANTAPAGIGISISEPLFSSANYYPEPDREGPVAGLKDAYGDLNQVDNTNGRFLDGPLDSQAGAPLKDEGLLPTGTTTNYKTVLLQRLANPLQPYDPVANPYRTSTVRIACPRSGRRPGRLFLLGPMNLGTRTIRIRTRRRESNSAPASEALHRAHTIFGNKQARTRTTPPPAVPRITTSATIWSTRWAI